MNRKIANPIVVLLGAFSQYQYQRLVDAYSAGYMLFCTIAFALLSGFFWFAALTSTAIYVADKPLLRGVETIGQVLAFEVKPHQSRRGGRMEYFTTVTYAFTTGDGRRFTNMTRRTLASPLPLTRGSRIDVLYEASNPAHSTMSAEIAVYLSGLQAFAWGTFFIGLFFWLYVYRYVQWRDGMRADVLRSRQEIENRGIR
jgi:hypothetical protein